jgi:anti-sigma28 factor (negative regulator of flagellin synthesis)
MISGLVPMSINRLLPSQRTETPVTEHLMAASKSCSTIQSEAQSCQDLRAERIETIRLAVQAGTYWIPGELIACRMIEWHLRASIQ